MMNIIKFLRHILPSSGYYVLVIIKNKKITQEFFSTIEKLEKAISIIETQNPNHKIDIYYAISSFKTKDNRKQSNVLATKAIAFDIDCGENKPYSTWKYGLKALGDFVSETGLPKPMIVHSGNGLHAYWVLDKALSPDQWWPLATAMKELARAKKLKIDPVVPTDSARILRPINTTNSKSGTKVKLLIDAPAISVKVLAKKLLHYPQIKNKKQTKNRKQTSALTQSIQIYKDILPSNSNVVASKCKQIKWAIENQTKVSEPLWYALLGVAAYCQNPEKTAIEWSNEYPEFDESETIKKLQQWKTSTTGPTTCEKFNQLNPERCKKCKYKGKITTPVQLSIQYPEVKQEDEDIPDIVAKGVELPKPYKRTKDGIKITIDDVDVDVCDFDIYPVSYGKDEGLGYEIVKFIWNRKHVGWQPLTLRLAHLTEGNRDFPIALADQGIILKGKAQTIYFQHMLRSYIEKLREQCTITNLYATMGWKEDFSQFVIGETLIRKEQNKVIEKPAATTLAAVKTASELWCTSGDLDKWIELTSIIEKADLKAHAFALSVGFSSILYAFTGLKGLTISFYGPTGSGKTLAQMWIQSIYGAPEKLHFSAKFTQNSLFNRMGLYNHMPMTIDEVTMLADEEIGDFIYWVSQGRDKVRMTRTIEERAAKTWAMPVIVSTNKSLNAKLIASNSETDAQLARLLEVYVPVNTSFVYNSYFGRKIYETITSNYGYAGRKFIKYLIGLGKEKIKNLITTRSKEFYRNYKAEFSGSERYWEQAIILADLAAELAYEWNLIKFNPRMGIEWVLPQLGAVRKNILEAKLNVFDILNEYLNKHMDSTLTVIQNGSSAPIVDMTRLPRKELRIRFNLHRPSHNESFDEGTIEIDRTHFRHWLSSRGFDYKTFMADLEIEGVLTPNTNKRIYIGRNSPLKLGQIYVIGINLDHPRLQGILSDMDEITKDKNYGRLRVV